MIMPSAITSKRSYVIVADAIKGAAAKHTPLTDEQCALLGDIVNRMSIAFKNDNPRFDRKQFEKAISPVA